MPNTFFQFKQFRVEQDRCAMKVCTDACILGAYTSAPREATHMLDIGTGTGLLSLMLAQRYPQARIDAVEVDASAYEQASANVNKSLWADNIELHRKPIQDFLPARKYQLIISNPPFYPAHLRSQNQQKNSAHHHDSLSFPELAQSIKRLLAPDGLCSILLPPRQAEEFSLPACKEELHVQHELLVQESSGHEPHRSIRFYSHSYKKSPSFDRLLIRNEDNSYSPHFRQLLQPYYFHF